MKELLSISRRLTDLMENTSNLDMGKISNEVINFNYLINKLTANAFSNKVLPVNSPVATNFLIAVCVAVTTYTQRYMEVSTEGHEQNIEKLALFHTCLDDHFDKATGKMLFLERLIKEEGMEAVAEGFVYICAKESGMLLHEDNEQRA